MDKLKSLLGIGAPGGVDDVVVRAVKAAITTFFAVLGADALGLINPELVEAAGIAALAAGANVIINTVLLWASK